MEESETKIETEQVNDTENIENDGELSLTPEEEADADTALAENLGVMPKEERARNAAKRRRKELDEAVESARREERERAENEFQERERVRKLAEEQIREIAKLDPSVKSLGDVTHSETGDKFREYVGKGLDFVEAYKLANMERLQREAKSATKKEAQKLYGSKEHLRPTVSRGQGAVRVPPEELEMYRELNPGMTESEILRHYNLYKHERR